MSSSEIAQFYSDQTIFLTGGTGFLGHLLLEKLLRVCYDLKTIYVLVREKKGKSAEQRFDQIFKKILFETLKTQQPEFRDKVKVIKGDCSEVGLGLSEDDKNLLKREVNIVLHAAANVRFDQSLKCAAYNNVRSLMDILDLAKEMTNLKAFVHVSTAFSNCHETHIKEEFYKPPIQAEELLSLVSIMNDETLERITPKLVDKWQNTYIFTKSIAEDLIKREMANLPICIVRPAIVMSTIEGPVPGWLHNLYGFGGVSLAISIGVLRTINLKLDAQIPVVPCDYVANTVLTAAWKTHKNRDNKENVKIYNYAGDNNQIFVWRDFVNIMREQRWHTPTNLMIWYPEVLLTESATLFRIFSFLLHVLPCYAADIVLTLVGKPAMAIEIYKKAEEVLNSTEYFRTTSWRFDQENLEAMWQEMNKTDRQLFRFTFDKLVISEYTNASFLFGRQHFLHDPPETIPRAKVKNAILFCVHYGIILLILYWFVKFLYFLLSFRLVRW